MESFDTNFPSTNSWQTDSFTSSSSREMDSLINGSSQSALANQDYTLIIRMTHARVDLAILDRSTSYMSNVPITDPAILIPTGTPDQLRIPFQMGQTEDGAFTYGTWAKEYHFTHPRSSKLWPLGYYLLDDLPFPSPLTVQHSQGHVCNIELELLLALFFRFLITQAETTYCEIPIERITTGKHIIVIVPMWFPSLARRRIVDAMQVIGKTVVIRDECTTLAYLHHHMLPPSPLTSLKWTKMLVFTETGGNVYLSFFVASGIEMHMVAITGNQFIFPEKIKEDQGLDQAIMMGQKFKTCYNENRTNIQKRMELVQGMLREMKDLIPENLRGLYDSQLTLVMHVEDRTWNAMAIEQFHQFFGGLAELVYFSWPPKLAYAKPMFENLCGDVKVVAPKPYTLIAREVYLPRSLDRMNWEVKDNCRMITVTRMTCTIVIFEKYCGGRELVMGTIEIAPFVYYLCDQVQIQIELTKANGVYKLTGLHGCNDKGEMTKVLECPEHYRYNAGPSAQKIREMSFLAEGL